MLRSLQPALPQAQTPFQIFKTDEQPIFRVSSRQEKPVSEQDVGQCEQLMSKMLASQQQLSQKAEGLLSQVGVRNYGKGMGYYNCKNLLLLNYLIELQFYQLFKINASDLTQGEGLQLYKRLAYLKSLIVKLNPVQKKLEYQKNKLLKFSDIVQVKPEPKRQRPINTEDNEDEEVLDVEAEIEDGDEQVQQEQEEQDEIEQIHESDQDDALGYQPRPQALMAVKQKKQKQQEKEGKYVAPKISAVLSKEDKKARRQQTQEQRRKAFLIRKFRGDLQDDQQARETGVGSDVAEKIKQKFREKTAMEEENFMRMPESKQEKYWRKSLIRQQQKSNPLEDQLKEIQTIREIFTDKQKEAAAQPFKRKAASTHKPKLGSKKVKRSE